ncbi:hypothetical protein H0H93_001792 [Arthromyces matolae]|nr:hypothetical protein H0H93_001792 [Arthromyces matolae]
MATDSNGRHREEKKRNNLSSNDSSVNGHRPSKLEIVQNTFLAPFQHKKRDSTKILSDLAPVIMTPRMINSAANSASRSRVSISSASLAKPRLDFATLGRAPLRMSLGSRRITSKDLQIVEATEELLDAEVPETDDSESHVSFLRGFNATIPSADQSRTRRRQMRNVETPRLGLKQLGMSARGLMTEEDDHEGQSVASEDDVVVVTLGDTGKKKKVRGRESLSAQKILGKEELNRQTQEIQRDKENLHVRRSLITNEITEITNKIAALDTIRAKLEVGLLKLQEDELELDDELVGVKERLEFERAASRPNQNKATAQPLHLPSSSRRRKGPAFLPSEHDELPPGVAFMATLDFSEPYGTLVSASQEDAQPRVWDLFSGSEIGRLRGHSGAVKCLQVEDHVCLTGGEDGNVRLWDLRRVEDDCDGWGTETFVSLSDVPEEDETQRDVDLENPSNSIRDGISSETPEKTGPCVRLLEGHTKAVTALYFEDDCLVTGASDKTLRQWDLNTGQCVMTMDILWAISHPPTTGNSLDSVYGSSSSSTIGSFAVPTPPYADGSAGLYEDYVGGVQFWGYGLVSGSGDGAVRMWDMRTGQAHRTLLGHTAPITCLQFDEIHIATGSLDKTIRIWDLRNGRSFETVHYDHGLSSLQFDTRKIVAAAGENGVKIYNRTSTEQSTLLTNGHTKPVDKLRYMDRYLVTGGSDAVLKIWSL